MYLSLKLQKFLMSLSNLVQATPVALDSPEATFLQ